MGNDDELAMANFNAGNITGHLSKMCGLPVLFHPQDFIENLSLAEQNGVPQEQRDLASRYMCGPTCSVCMHVYVYVYIYEPGLTK